MNGRTKTVAIILAIAVAVGIPGFLFARRSAQRNQCVNNLRLIFSVQDCCAPLANKWAEGQKMDLKICASYMPGNAIPACPAGGQLISTWIVGGHPPKCSIHGGIPSLQQNHGSGIIPNINGAQQTSAGDGIKSAATEK